MLAGVLRELDPDGIPVPLLQIGVTDARFFGQRRDRELRLPADGCRTTSWACSTSTRPTSASPRRARVRRRSRVARRAEVPLRILVLGGTKFLARSSRRARAGHELTLFNRGETNPGLFPEVEQLRGDRARDLALLEGRSWDAVVDPSGYVPSVVRASAELLRDTSLYVFVSSVSVYADFSTGPHEESVCAELGEASVDELAEDYSNYGALKAPASARSATSSASAA